MIPSPRATRRPPPETLDADCDVRLCQRRPGAAQTAAARLANEPGLSWKWRKRPGRPWRCRPGWCG